jgi:CheY-like chemotaxis protein/predicted regulator of Ras-like GTPase activity (Roadblock/LC7/MglB family)
MTAHRVLVVDDSLSVRRAIERMLAPRGWTVMAAAAGSEAIDLLEAERPSLVICDVMLPEVDGYQVCRFVGRRPRLEGVPVLLISGAVSPEIEARSAAAGAAGLLTKPFTAESLLSWVDGLVGGGRPAGSAVAGPEVGRVLADLLEVHGAVAAYALDLETGAGRGAAGGSPPDRLVALARASASAAGELGLGGRHELLVDGDEGTLVIHRVGRVSFAVHFDGSSALGLARHQVRRLCGRHGGGATLHEPSRAHTRGDRNGDRPR